VSDLAPLKGLANLQTLDCSGTQVSDLAPLKGLANLQTLDCSETQVSDLAPLKGLANLQTLDCSETQVSDLGPLKGLANLQTLDCSGTQVSDLAPLKGLANLQTVNCSETQVSDLAPLKGLANLQTLDCSETQVSDLSPLKGLPALQTLYCSETQVSDLSPLKGLPNLQTVNCSETQVSDLAPLKGLPALQTLNCSRTQVSDLAPLKGLPALQTLYCSGTQVSDLAPLKGLPALQTLYCLGTQVSDLGPLKGLPALQTLDCLATQVSDLGPLRGLPALQTLNCSRTQVSDLGPLKGLPALQTLDCSGTQVSDLGPLKGLPALQTLDCSGTQVSDLAPLKGLPALQTLDCSGTQVSDLAPLKGLPALQTLDCSETQVGDLAPLKGLPALQTLYCSRTQVSDLAPLKGLPALQTLYCPGTQVSDLAPLKGLPNLQTLYCSRTQVGDLAPLKGLPALQTLNCLGTQVSDLGPLKGLPALQTLECSETQVSNLAPLKGLPALQTLDCSETQVGDLAPLKGLPALQTLDCSGTQVSDLAPLNGLPALQTLDCSRCRLTDVSADFWLAPSLNFLILLETYLPGIPAEVLSQGRYDSCLESLRAHLSDLGAGQESVPDVKLMVLGNGRIGKTQMCRRLRGEQYDESVQSTHGIMVTSASLPQSQGGDTIRLQIWDFGGQDIYLGTHALFMRSRAIVPLLWIPETENVKEYRHEGILFRNRPLVYWLDYVRQFSGTECPVLIIQTRCDKPEDEQIHPPVSDEALSTFRFRKLLHYSAHVNRGRAALDEALQEAAAWLRNREGIATIGAGRFRVKQRIEKMRDDDAARRPSERRHRTIGYEDFLRMCKDAGGIVAPEHALSYLHNAGTVFYRRGLFDNQIIIDQGWALEAIYSVFNRDKCYRQLLRQNGRFTRADLVEWVWDETGYGVKEQELFLSMMQSCDVCFVHRPAVPSKNIETEYITPDLLPERPEIEIAQKWDPDLPIQSTEFTYSLLTPGLMRAIISRIGRQAGLAADYWRDGVYVYETGTGSRALIEQETTIGWQGRIMIRTQRGDATVLLERLTALVDESQRRIGITPASVRTSVGPPPKAVLPQQNQSAAPPLEYAQEPAANPEYFVSYAWGDRTPEGRRRESIVDKLCAAAEARDISILRDKKTLGLGDRISKFMQRLGRADRIFVVLSEKYLKSPYCMFELFEVWRNCRQDDQEFLNRIRVYTLPEAMIWTPVDRAKCAAYWKEESDKLEALVKQYGYDVLGEKDHKHYKMMKEFFYHIGDILATVADILQPKNFEEFERYGLQDNSKRDDSAAPSM
jgi:internalin A